MKITRKDIQKTDNERLLEMIVDTIADKGPDGGAIKIQFWTDVQLYGLDEAISYLRGYRPGGDFVELCGLRSEIRLWMTYSPKHHSIVGFSDGTRALLAKDGLSYIFCLKDIRSLLSNLPSDPGVWYFNDTRDRCCAERNGGLRRG